MEWKGLSKSVNAEGAKGYHVASARRMTNAHVLCLACKYGEFAGDG